MHKVVTVAMLREIVNEWRAERKTIAFVPTMGNLHAGHLQLVKQAKHRADKVVVSIFVNPTQFGVGEDFEAYPRTEKADLEKLTEVAADLLFLPSVSEMYSSVNKTTISVAALSIVHCGTSRPDHFDGVATVVGKLFNMVQPDWAFFGEKDFQQLLLIKTMVADLNIALEVVGVKTQREKDGLAMSSRNGFLTKQERQIAPELFRCLSHARDEVLLGWQDFRKLEEKSVEQLLSLGFKVDYFSICNSSNLELANDRDTELVILCAARLGKPRLIDNICFSR